MITTAITGAVGFLFTAIFYLLPVVKLADLPLFGSAISSTLTTAVLTWNAFMVTFPYAATVWSIFLYLIVPFEFTMIIAKFLLGHRTPTNA